MDVVAFGGIIVDNVVSADGRVNRATLGGNAVYCAAGARLWLDRVGIVGIVPANYPMAWIQALATAGIDTRGIAVAADNVDLSEWFFYAADGSRADHLYAADDAFTAFGLSGDVITAAEAAAFQAHLRASSPAGRGFGEFRQRHPVNAALVPPAYRDTRAVHLAPSLPQAQRALVQSLQQPGRLITIDPGSHAPAWASAPLAPLFAGLTAFLPSEKELAVLAPERSNSAGLRQLVEAGIGIALVKLGARGSLLRTAQSASCWQIMPLAVTARDPTGAGDAYCGGFLAGLLLTGDPLQAAGYGTVSASFAVEAFGPFHLLEADRSLAQQRLAQVTYGLLQEHETEISNDS
ncbi:MAG: hypothetical protein H7274_12005 [Rhodoferax sp.]|nr:hypothetical protein [Rhodoferax sp.]